MNVKIKSMIQQAGTDCSGKWMALDHAEKFADLLINEIEQYIEESSGDTDYVRFLIDRNLRNKTEQLQEKSYNADQT